MRILTVGNMYPPHHLGGYELTWRSAVEHLRAAGHQVRVLTTDYRRSQPDPDIPEDPEARRVLHWYWHDHQFPRMSPVQRAALERHNGRVLADALQEVDPGVVNWWAMGGMSLSLVERVRRSGVPAVGVVGDDWMAYGPKVDAWTRLVRRLGPLGPGASRLAGVPGSPDLSGVTWLFNSEATRRRALATNFRLDRTDVVHPGIDAELFRATPSSDWSWSLLYVGRIDERKGVDAAVEALARLPNEATLTVLGSGDERFMSELRALCGRLCLNGRVEFGVRPRKELPAAYAQADALLFPVRWQEPWGLVPLEAMAVGTPVVATGTGGSREYLRDGENALVIGKGAEPGDLAAAVRRLASDSELRDRLRAGGLRTASRYTEEAYNEAIAGALERAASSSRARHE